MTPTPEQPPGPPCACANGSTRRGFFFKLGIGVNVVAGTLLALPLVGYVFSSFRRGRPEKWISLGPISGFPAGTTRLATYRNPGTRPWDGKTGELPCWVRSIEGGKFQVFAINCAHLGCPVRWFPQSGLFLCPCHGGAYYRDGGRASGPPERGLFEYPSRVQDGVLTIQAGELPTPGAVAALAAGKPPCA
jgi:menaquinol-cytochrome c reductase iron-sulfur subunit